MVFEMLTIIFHQLLLFVSYLYAILCEFYKIIFIMDIFFLFYISIVIF